MITAAERIVEAFVQQSWKSKPVEAVNALIRTERDQALPLALLVLERIPAGGTFFDQVLSHVTEEEFRTIVDRALTMLSRDKTDVLESVVAYASVQCPHLLTPHLRELFAIQPNRSTYYSHWPWRAADQAEVARLRDLVMHGTDADTQRLAWECLVGTRCAAAIRFAGKHSHIVQLDSSQLESYAQLAGFDVSTPEAPRALHTAQSYHVVPPTEYFEGLKRAPWRARDGHPSWTLEAAPADEAFAGQIGGPLEPACGSCGEPLHRLLHLENADVLFGASMPRIDLCTCLSCLGWESSPLFFAHDRTGHPTALGSASERVKPQFPSGPLQASSVRYVKSPARWTFQDWGLSNGRENLNRVGGAPSWIQDAQYPACPHCQQLMPFCAQLDSELPTAGGEEWLWGSGGICYMFWCDPCSVSANLYQCT